MDSSPSSNFAFYTSDGVRLDGPSEWSTCVVALGVPVDRWQDTLVTRNGLALEPYVKHLGGEVRVLVDWPLSGAGSYRLTARAPDGTREEIVRIGPLKLSDDSYRALLDDLQRRLPASIAISLQQGGALSGLQLIAPQETTLAEEFHRLQRACKGTLTRAGLTAVMSALAERPHQVLDSVNVWTPRDRARRVDPALLYQVYLRPANLDENQIPLAVPERRVEHSVDVYENQLVKTFHDQVGRRLRRLVGGATRAGSNPLADEAKGLLRDLDLARRTASFLDNVRDLQGAPDKVTMVLLKGSAYRAALEGFLEFRRSALVQLDEPRLEAPLTNLPALYEAWGTLTVIDAAARAAVAAGYKVQHEQLTHRRQGELWIRVLPNGRPALVLTRASDNTVIRLIPQRSYTNSSKPLRSVSFTQKPDVAFELSAPGEPTKVWIFDPKYKLDSEQATELLDAKPKKVDIDTMHAYRDSVRDEIGTRVVNFAAILYPGPTHGYGPGLCAIHADPGDRLSLRVSVETVLAEPLSPGAAPLLVA